MSVFDNLMDLQRQINTQQTLLNQILRVDRPSVSPVKVVAVEYAEFTGTQSASVAGGGNVAITNLSITHAMANAGNKLLLIGSVGLIASSLQYIGAGIAIAKDGALITTGAAVGNRTPIGAGILANYSAAVDYSSSSIVGIYEHLPASTAAKTYTVRAINLSGSIRTIYINRTETDANLVFVPRSMSSFCIIEVGA